MILGNVTKRDLILDVAQSTGFTQAQIRVVVEELFVEIRDSLGLGRKVEIRGFGTFTAKERKPRAARNPKTGSPVLLEGTVAPLFKFSSDLKERIDNSRLEKQLQESDVQRVEDQHFRH